MVNFNSFGAKTTLQSLVKICHFDPCFLAKFWGIQELFFCSRHQFKSTFSFKINSSCQNASYVLEINPKYAPFDLFFRFFNAVFGDPDLCYACPSVPPQFRLPCSSLLFWWDPQYNMICNRAQWVYLLCRRWKELYDTLWQINHTF